MQSLFAEFYLLLELLGFSCQRRLVFGIYYLIGPLQPFSAQGGDNRDDVCVPDATSQAVWASCEIEVAEERYETLLTRFVAMKARC